MALFLWAKIAEFEAVEYFASVCVFTVLKVPCRGPLVLLGPNNGSRNVPCRNEKRKEIQAGI